MHFKTILPSVAVSLLSVFGSVDDSYGQNAKGPGQTQSTQKPAATYIDISVGADGKPVANFSPDTPQLPEYKILNEKQKANILAVSVYQDKLGDEFLVATTKNPYGGISHDLYFRPQDLKTADQAPAFPVTQHSATSSPDSTVVDFPGYKLTYGKNGVSFNYGKDGISTPKPLGRNDNEKDNLYQLNPDQRKLVGMIEDPASHTVTVITEPALYKEGHYKNFHAHQLSADSTLHDQGLMTNVHRDRGSSALLADMMVNGQTVTITLSRSGPSPHVSLLNGVNARDVTQDKQKAIIAQFGKQIGISNEKNNLIEP